MYGPINCRPRPLLQTKLGLSQTNIGLNNNVKHFKRMLAIFDFKGLYIVSCFTRKSVNKNDECILNIVHDETGTMQFLQKLNKTIPNVVAKGVPFRPKKYQVCHTIILLKNLVSTCLRHVIDMSRLFCMSVSKCLSLRSIKLSSYRDVLFPTLNFTKGTHTVYSSSSFYTINQ